jgi:hypothetical protein
MSLDIDRMIENTTAVEWDGRDLLAEIHALNLRVGTAVRQRDSLRKALEPFLRLDYDIGDEWHEVCERARVAYGGKLL